MIPQFSLYRFLVKLSLFRYRIIVTSKFADRYGTLIMTLRSFCPSRKYAKNVVERNYCISREMSAIHYLLKGVAVRAPDIKGR